MKLHCCFAVVSVLIIVPARTSRAAAAEEDGSALIEFLKLENEKTAARLRSVSFHVRATFESHRPADGKVAGTVEATITRSGNAQYASYRRRSSAEADRTASEMSTRSIVTDTYFAFWATGASCAELYDYESLDKMPEYVRARREVFAPPDYLLFGFGNGDETLREALNDGGPRIVRKVARGMPGQPQVYRIDEYANAGARHPFMTIVIDPSKGFLITKVLTYASAGVVGIETTVGAQLETPSNIWFPVSIEERTHRAWLDERAGAATGPALAEDVVTITRIDLQDVRVNIEVPRGSFELQGLELPKDTPILHTNTRGSREVGELVHGVFVPMDVIKRLADEGAASRPSTFRGD